MIPKEKYKEILESMPVLCVDLIIKNENKEFLLLKRRNKPLKGEFWIPGGRVRKKELIMQAAERIAFEETGLAVKIKYVYGYYEGMFPDSEFDIDCHTVSIVFMCEAQSTEVKLDIQSIAYIWSKKLPGKLYESIYNRHWRARWQLSH